jgi:hypothetical protein
MSVKEAVAGEEPARPIRGRLNTAGRTIVWHTTLIAQPARKIEKVPACYQPGPFVALESRPAEEAPVAISGALQGPHGAGQVPR